MLCNGVFDILVFYSILNSCDAAEQHIKVFRRI